jgi:hypothetical protein
MAAAEHTHSYLAPSTAALVTKSPDLRRVATDVVVTSVDDGRFDSERLGGALAWLAATGLVKLARLQASLRDAGRTSALHAAQTARLAEIFLARLERIAAGVSSSSKLGSIARGLLGDAVA